MAQILLQNGTAPSTPASGYSAIYSKTSDKGLYLKDETGAEKIIFSNATPAFSAYLPTAAQSVTSGVETKVSLSAEEFDTTNAFDSTTNYRFQPTVAGYYQMSWLIDAISTGTTITVAYSILYKNGVVFKLGEYYGGPAVSRLILPGTALVFLNGSSDYLELFGNIVSTSPKFGFGVSNTYLSGVLVRQGA